MTYLEFHLFFTLPLFSALLYINRHNNVARTGKAWIGTATLVALALGYTTPWDSYLIREGIWSYSTERVLGTLYLIPYEEYFFMVIQTVSACLLLMKILEISRRNYVPGRLSSAQRTIARLVMVVLLTLVGTGIPFLFENGPYRYLALIVVWGAPIVLLQWSVGHAVLFQFWREGITAFTLLTGYFCWADWMAIQRGIWLFPEGTVTNYTVATHLPVEEALFFCVTNVMVIQGFILFNKMPLRRHEH